MIAALLAMTLAASEPIEVAVVKSVGTTPERVADLGERVVKALQARALTAAAGGAPAEALKCGTGKACITALAHAHGAAVVVTLYVAHVLEGGETMKASLLALDVKTGQTLAEQLVVVPSAGYPAGLDVQLAEFVGQLTGKLEVRPDPVAPVVEAPPAVVVLEPAPVAPPQRQPPWLTIGLGALTVAAGATAVGFGLSSRAHVSAAQSAEFQAYRVSELDAASSTATVANVLFIVTGVAFAATLVSLLFWPSADGS